MGGERLGTCGDSIEDLQHRIVGNVGGYGKGPRLTWNDLELVHDRWNRDGLIYAQRGQVYPKDRVGCVILGNICVRAVVRD